MIVMTTKKTPAKKTTSKKAAPAKKAVAKVASVKKEATEISDEAEMPEPDTAPVVSREVARDDIVEAEIIEDVEDSVANAISILSATSAADTVDALFATGMTDVIDVLSVADRDAVRDAVRYLGSYVDSHPDIDELVDRKTERAALLGYQAWMRGGDRALEVFLFDRWELPRPRSNTVPGGGAHARSLPSQPQTTALLGVVPSEPPEREGVTDRPTPSLRKPREPKRWVPKVPGDVERPTGTLQTMEQAFDEARGEGYFTERAVE